jgi:hypothetical protein
MTVSVVRVNFCFAELFVGLGSVVVFLTTLFALWKGVSDGSTAIVIVQAGIFADASRQLVKYVDVWGDTMTWITTLLHKGSRSTRT